MVVCMMNLKEYLETEITKISALEPSKRVRYIAEYYWLWITAAAFAVFFAGYMIYHIFFTVKENWLYITFTNVMEAGDMAAELKEEYAGYCGYDLKEKNIVFNTASYFDASLAGGTNNTYFQVFTAAVEAGELDAVIMNTENLKATGASGILLDLSCEQYQKYEDLFVYTMPYDTSYSESPVAVGIDISSSKLVSEYHLYDEDCVLGVGAYSGHPDAVAAFLEFIGIHR